MAFQSNCFLQFAEHFVFKKITFESIFIERIVTSINKSAGTDSFSQKTPQKTRVTPVSCTELMTEQCFKFVLRQKCKKKTF